MRSRWHRPRLWLGAGIAAFALVLASYLLFVTMHPAYQWSSPVDLHVYDSAGLIVRGLGPFNPHLAAPLYDWHGGVSLKFTYPPFAALLFTVLTLPPWGWLPDLWIAANIVALLAAIWATLGGLGYRAWATRLGGTLLVAAAVLWTEPVQRTLYLGQIELILLALIMWDMCQPDRSRWKGIGIGIAAGIKLVPLIFIPYLLLTRRFRQAAVAAGTFAATIGLGFIWLPADSRAWWIDGLFIKTGRTGFVGWEGNQSLQALITRLSGSIAAGEAAWLAAAVVFLLVGLAAAMTLHRAGLPVLGVLTCALTGLLVSPVSWDHHWVWIVPGITVLAVLGLRAAAAARWAYLAAAALAGGIFAAWPGFWWGQWPVTSGYFLGLIWIPPHSNPGAFARIGDQPWYAEYHWSGLQLLAGNLYVLTGLAFFLALVAAAVGVLRGGRRAGRGQPGDAASSITAAATPSGSTI